MPRKPQITKTPTPLQRAVYEIVTSDGWSINRLANEAGVAESGIRKFLKGDGDGMTINTVKKLADASGVPLLSVVASLSSARPRLVGRIGAGAVVHLFPGDVSQGMNEQVEAPEGIKNPETLEALEVEGDSMLPFEDGWLVFYRKGEFRPPAELVNRLCVVRVRGGMMMLKYIRRGYEPGRWNLASWNAPMLEDQIVEEAAPVVSVVPRYKRAGVASIG